MSFLYLLVFTVIASLIAHLILQAKGDSIIAFTERSYNKVRNIVTGITVGKDQINEGAVNG